MAEIFIKIMGRTIMNQNIRLRNLLWKFGIWDDLTHIQHVELEALITQVEREARIKENLWWVGFHLDGIEAAPHHKRIAELEKKEGQ